jgi:hypothetical protein
MNSLLRCCHWQWQTFIASVVDTCDEFFTVPITPLSETFIVFEGFTCVNNTTEEFLSACFADVNDTA